MTWLHTQGPGSKGKVKSKFYYLCQLLKLAIPQLPCISKCNNNTYYIGLSWGFSEARNVRLQCTLGTENAPQFYRLLWFLLLVIVQNNKLWWILGILEQEGSWPLPSHRSLWKQAGGGIRHTAEMKTRGPSSAPTSLSFFSTPSHSPETSTTWVMGQWRTQR